MSDIKKCFISRFDEGKIMEVDYSQLEVIGLAQLSQDPQLIQDLLDGLDTHSYNAAQLFGYPFNEFLSLIANDDPDAVYKRKIAKTCSFQLQYGAGANSMAKSNGIPVSLAKAFISNYYNRYPRVKEWQDEVAQAVKESRQLTGKHTPGGYPKGKGTYVSCTGRRYTFFEYDGNEYDKRDGNNTVFSSTQMKNYPVQGFSTGDIVPIALGQLHRALSQDEYLHDKCLPINTVHDSVVFDVLNEKTIIHAARVIKDVMENIPAILKEDFGIDFVLPLKVDIEYGDSWGNMNNRVVL